MSSLKGKCYADFLICPIRANMLMSFWRCSSPLGGVSAKAMFGGYGIYKDALMFGLVADNVF